MTRYKLPSVLTSLQPSCPRVLSRAVLGNRLARLMQKDCQPLTHYPAMDVLLASA